MFSPAVSPGMCDRHVSRTAVVVRAWLLVLEAEIIDASVQRSRETQAKVQAALAVASLDQRWWMAVGPHGVPCRT